MSETWLAHLTLIGSNADNSNVEMVKYARNVERERERESDFNGNTNKDTILNAIAALQRVQKDPGRRNGGNATPEAI